MVHLVIKSSRLLYIILLICTLGFVVGGIFLIIKGEAVLIGWASIIFFGGGIPLFLWQLMDSRPRLIIDDEGVYDRTLKIGKISWEDVEGGYVKNISGSNFICLELKNEEKYLSQLNSIGKAAVSANVKLGFTPISLNLSGISEDPYEILNLILKLSKI